MKNGMKRLFVAVLLAAMMVSAFSGMALAAEAGAKPADEIKYCYMHRLYNPNSGEHFYTGSEEERDDLVSAGWQYEGKAWAAPTNSGEPVYRMYNPNAGDHHYTMSAEERDNLVKVGWQYEGVAWNSLSDNVSVYGIAHYRLYNPNADAGSHHYSASVAELNNLVAAGWQYEGVAWYGYAVDATNEQHQDYSHSFKFEADWVDSPDGCRYYACGCGVRIAIHDSRWLMTKAPTKTMAGVKERVCNICGKKETAAIPAGNYESLSGDRVYFEKLDGSTLGNNLYSVNPDGSNLQFVVSVRSSIFDYDDGFVLCVGDNHDIFADLYIYNTATKEKIRLTEGRQLPLQTSIAFVDGNAYYSAGSLNAFHYNLESRESKEIPFPGDVSIININAVNGKVYLLGSENGLETLYTYDPETMTSTPVNQYANVPHLATLPSKIVPADSGVVIEKTIVEEQAKWKIMATFVPEDNSEAYELYTGCEGKAPVITSSLESMINTLYYSENGILYSSNLLNNPIDNDSTTVLMYASVKENDSGTKQIVNETVLFAVGDGGIGCEYSGDDRLFITVNEEYYLFDAKFFDQTGALIPLDIDINAAK